MMRRPRYACCAANRSERRSPSKAGATVAWAFYAGAWVLRSRIVLLAAEGLQNKQIAAVLRVAPRMAALWRARFLEHGIEGLLQDAPRPGRTATICRASLIDKTTQSIPPNATQWSTRTMAREMGISKLRCRASGGPAA